MLKMVSKYLSSPRLAPTSKKHLYKHQQSKYLEVGSDR